MEINSPTDFYTFNSAGEKNAKLPNTIPRSELIRTAAFQKAIKWGVYEGVIQRVISFCGKKKVTAAIEKIAGVPDFVFKGDAPSDKQRGYMLVADFKKMEATAINAANKTAKALPGQKFVDTYEASTVAPEAEGMAYPDGEWGEVLKSLPSAPAGLLIASEVRQFDSEVLWLAVENPFILKMTTDRYVELLKDIIKTLFNTSPELKITLK
jgi:hypothetical protein